MRAKADTKILIVNLEEGAFYYTDNSSPPVLSTQLCEFAEEKKYDGFCVYTDRPFQDCGKAVDERLTSIEFTNNMSYPGGNAPPFEAADDLFVSPRIEKLSRALAKAAEENGLLKSASPKYKKGLYCYAVSMPDDRGHNCGHGYDQLVAYEQKVMATKHMAWQELEVLSEGEHFTEVEGHWTSYDFNLGKTGNEEHKKTVVAAKVAIDPLAQLVQLINFLLAEIPGKITIDYAEGNRLALNQALSLAKLAHWPARLELNIYLLYTCLPLIYKGTIRSLDATSEEQWTLDHIQVPSFKERSGLTGCCAFFKKACCTLPALSFLKARSKIHAEQAEAMDTFVEGEKRNPSPQ